MGKKTHHKTKQNNFIQDKHTSSAFCNNTAPFQQSMCMFLQTPPGGNRHQGYSAAIRSPRPMVSLQLVFSIFQTSTTATAVFAVPVNAESQASPVYLKGSAHAAIRVEAHRQASGWRDRNRDPKCILQTEPARGDSGLLAAPLSPGGFLLAQQGKGRKSKEKRSSGVSVSWLPIKPSSVDQTQQVTNNISNTRREPDL